MHIQILSQENFGEKKGRVVIVHALLSSQCLVLHPLFSNMNLENGLT